MIGCTRNILLKITDIANGLPELIKIKMGKCSIQDNVFIQYLEVSATSNKQCLYYWTEAKLTVNISASWVQIMLEISKQGSEEERLTEML